MNPLEGDAPEAASPPRTSDGKPISNFNEEAPSFGTSIKVWSIPNISHFSWLVKTKTSLNQFPNLTEGQRDPIQRFLPLHRVTPQHIEERRDDLLTMAPRVDPRLSWNDLCEAENRRKAQGNKITLTTMPRNNNFTNIFLQQLGHHPDARRIKSIFFFGMGSFTDPKQRSRAWDQHLAARHIIRLIKAVIYPNISIRVFFHDFKYNEDDREWAATMCLANGVERKSHVRTGTRHYFFDYLGKAQVGPSVWVSLSSDNPYRQMMVQAFEYNRVNATAGSQIKKTSSFHWNGSYVRR
jgi:hypothetical protein